MNVEPIEAVILAGGRGTRLRPYTDRVPKPLLPLDGTPIIEILIRQLSAAGCARVTLALSWMAEAIQAHFERNPPPGIEIAYSVSERMLGTAGPLGLLPAPLGPCLVANADLLTSLDFRALWEAHRREHLATVAYQRRDVAVRYGVIEPGPNGTALGILEKPSRRLCVNTGVYVLGAEAWEHIRPGARLEMPDLLHRLALGGPVVGAYEVPADAVWTDIGLPAEYLEADSIFKLERARFLAPASAVGASLLGTKAGQAE